ncbi:DoxX family membrane protein [Brevibacillus ruminantium]|uniref:DoxX family membrane protein n=1 Tax=Brevibacillus ruminantium TaxID=2950604 RepID=A0ABY4WRQ4_9BACL|nr:MauE/DoxX family redox-associated membrane protein [Brevibacillus ruminantium]USG67271.1 DoxX family membrane protein [Brevibacillus ruminantium]
MDELILFLRVMLGTLFISAAVTKIGDLEKYTLIIKEYKILPEFTLYLFVRFKLVAEITTGVFILVGLYLPFMYLIACFLMLLYTLAITINLLRGRREISCGCGGMAGNHQLSWTLTIRNLAIFFGCYWLYLSSTDWGSLDALFSGQRDHFFHLEVLQVILISMLTLIMGTMSKLLFALHKQIKNLKETLK